jgi:hypothetical protein
MVGMAAGHEGGIIPRLTTENGVPVGLLPAPIFSSPFWILFCFRTIMQRLYSPNNTVFTNMIRTSEGSVQTS